MNKIRPDPRRLIEAVRELLKALEALPATRRSQIAAIRVQDALATFDEVYAPKP